MRRPSEDAWRLEFEVVLDYYTQPLPPVKSFQQMCLPVPQRSPAESSPVSLVSSVELVSQERQEASPTKI